MHVKGLRYLDNRETVTLIHLTQLVRRLAIGRCPNAVVSETRSNSLPITAHAPGSRISRRALDQFAAVAASLADRQAEL
jgi:hypothetical protein